MDLSLTSTSFLFYFITGSRAGKQIRNSVAGGPAFGSSSSNAPPVAGSVVSIGGVMVDLAASKRRRWAAADKMYVCM